MGVYIYFSARNTRLSFVRLTRQPLAEYTVKQSILTKTKTLSYSIRTAANNHKTKGTKSPQQKKHEVI